MNDLNVFYERLSPTHVAALAQLHFKTLGGQLTFYGPRFIRLFYAAAIGTPGTLGWVAIEKGQVMGFVFGSLLGENILRPVTQKHPWTGLQMFTEGLLTHSTHFIKEVWASRLPQPERKPTVPYLHYIAVDPSLRNQQIGESLMSRFAKDLREARAAHFELSVPSTNALAIAFYERLGGRKIEQVQRPDGLYNRYTFASTLPVDALSS